jgi:CubicO group peptidase (beta-lactamase class C family)
MPRPSRTLWLFLLAVLIPPGKAAAEPLADKEVAPLVNEALKRWGPPGLAVAVLRGEVVYAQGFGVREQGKKDAITPDTVFSIGSLTKAFTATALAILVDERKAGWDDRVREHLPAFRLFDPLADREVRLRDLLCHRTGLARHDLLWYRASWPVEESIRRLAFLEPASSFRSKYEYNNLAYLVAGQAIARAAGAPWHTFVQDRLFAPLGMKSADFTASAARALPDHATPHRRDASGKLQSIDWYPDDKQIRASGSIKTSAADLVRWMRLQLNEGVYAGKRIVSAEALAETHTPQIVVPLDRDLARLTETTQAGYGLGWQIRDYRGRRLLEHGGATDGFRARILLVPKEKVGLVLLTNVEETEFLSATGNVLLDHVLGLEAKDWHGFFRKRFTAARERKAPPVKRRPGTKPSLEPAGYAGTYRDRAYGDATIQAEGKQLVLSWSGFRVELEHYHYDTFIVRAGKDAAMRRLEGDLAVFTLDGAGAVATLGMLGRTFRRQGAK